MELSARGIGHAYGDLAVLEGVDLGVADGEIVAVIGPSGCGKSTLLGILGGLIAPARGEVQLTGAPPRDCLNPLTFVFQDFALLPWRTVSGNISLPLEHHALTAGERRERLEAVLARLGLAEFRDAFPRQLSGGMRQRVGIARALVVRPAVLLLDEPLSALDAQTRELLMEDFLALWLDRRVAAIYVTHNLGEALRASASRPRPSTSWPAWGGRSGGCCARRRRKPTARSSMLEAGSRAIAFRGGGFEPHPRRAAAWVAFALVLLLWQASSSAGLVGDVFLPSPWRIALALRELAASGELWRQLSASLSRIAAGWVLGTVAGIALGGAIGLYSLARSVGIPFVSALFPIPKIALLPLLILWLGIGEPSKVATIALGVFFPTVIATFSGIDHVPRTLIRMGQSFDLPFAAILGKIVLPGAMPSLLAGFRVSAATALLLVVAAEMIGAENGIGAFINTAGNLMRTDQLMAGVVVLAAVGLVIGWLLSLLERRLLRWR
jgi:NitT/TauT family transport system permease protein